MQHMRVSGAALGVLAAGLMMIGVGVGRPAVVRAHAAPAQTAHNQPVVPSQQQTEEPGATAAPLAKPALAAQTIMAAKVSDETPIPRAFALLTGPAGKAGDAPPAPGKVSGLVEACAAGPEAGGMVVVIFDEDSSIELDQTGCGQATLNGASGMSVQALRGSWDVVLRRLTPLEPGMTAPAAAPAETYLVMEISPRRPLGRSVSIMVTPDQPAETPPDAVKAYSGRLEVCASGPRLGGRVDVRFNDERVMQITEPGCFERIVSEVGSVTVVAPAGDWTIVVRRLA